MVRTSEMGSRLSNKPAQMLNSVLILNDFSLQLLCIRDQSPPKAMPTVRARKEGSLIKETLFVQSLALVQFTLFLLKCFFLSQLLL